MKFVIFSLMVFLTACTPRDRQKASEYIEEAEIIELEVDQALKNQGPIYGHPQAAPQPAAPANKPGASQKPFISINQLV